HHDLGKYADHAEYGTKQTQQRGNRGNGAQCTQITFQLVDNHSSDLFNGCGHGFAALTCLHQTGSKNLTQRRTYSQFTQVIGVEFVVFDPGPDLANNVFGGDAIGAQRPEALDHNGNSQNRTQNNWQHQPAAGHNNFYHNTRLL